MASEIPWNSAKLIDWELKGVGMHICMCEYLFTLWAPILPEEPHFPFLSAHLHFLWMLKKPQVEENVPLPCRLSGSVPSDVRLWRRPHLPCGFCYSRGPMKRRHIHADDAKKVCLGGREGMMSVREGTRLPGRSAGAERKPRSPISGVQWVNRFQGHRELHIKGSRKGRCCQSQEGWRGLCRQFPFLSCQCRCRGQGRADLQRSVFLRLKTSCHSAIILRVFIHFGEKNFHRSTGCLLQWSLHVALVH